MNEAGILSFLKAVGVRQVFRDNPPWLRSACPLASALHENGRDDHPSFGIKINPRGESIYHCFACGGGLLVRLLHNLFVCGLPYKEASRVYGECEIFDGKDTPAEKVFSVIGLDANKGSVPTDVLERFPLITTSSYETKRCREYLTQRGISEEVQEKFQLRIYPSFQAIVFPRMDKEGNVWALRARPRKFKSFFSISPSFLGDDREWGDYSTWFGAQFLDTETPPLPVESETDVLRLYSLGVNLAEAIPIGCCGALQRPQLEALYQDVMFLGFDADMPGKRNFQRAFKIRKGAVLFKLDWAMVGRKDAGELESLEEYKAVWRNRKMLPF